MKLKIAIPLIILSSFVLLLILYAVGVVEFKLPKSKKDFNYSGYVDEEPELLIDNQIFLNKIKHGFKTMFISNYFGAGQHEFLFALMIGEDNNIVDFYLRKRKNHKWIVANHLMNKSKIQSILRTIPVESGRLKGKNVDSKIYLPLIVGIDNKGQVQMDWTVKVRDENRIKRGGKYGNLSDEAYTFVEQMPNFPGGSEKLMGWLGQTVQYPQAAKSAGIQGRVMVQFVVEKSGKISEVTVLRGIGGGCDEEALRVCRLMPRWEPGRQDGKPVRVRMVIPFLFKLQ